MDILNIWKILKLFVVTGTVLVTLATILFVPFDFFSIDQESCSILNCPNTSFNVFICTAVLKKNRTFVVMDSLASLIQINKQFFAQWCSCEGGEVGDNLQSFIYFFTSLSLR